ncbi:GGDEF domain-containing protein [Billgrantia gudaonensis]|uniref:diguanylate cyclase n=1 Tax=Billgrantia gudaonensis TaxID=376427 RepID=A0A1G8TCI5_9GAMM|nr:GGDEF domain-containing protein [Halomonas gudaonensis]SDJ38625.1 diguanylate cyclase (GGDEF) domain-containing protein [Halomonas gudaonensis]
MKDRRTFALGWGMALGFSLLSGICAMAIGLYVANARQHVGANYTALVADVVRAQQHPVLLRATLNAMQEHPHHLHAERLANLVWRIPQHIRGVSHGLSQSQLAPSDYRPALDTLARVETRLAELAALIDADIETDEDRQALQALGYELETELAWAYGELNDLIHVAAGEQRQIMERLSLAIGLLVLLALAVVAGLMLALIRLSRQRELVSRLSLVDDLTGLGNRRYLLETAERLYQQSLRNERPMSLALLDLDHFKHLNDTWGHPAGDRVLEAFAQALQEETRQADIVARIGGEEFCILMPDTPLEGAHDLAERVRHRIAELNEAALGIPASITVSLGLATGTGSAAGFDRLYSRADRALYRAKANGRNRTEVSKA